MIKLAILAFTLAIAAASASGSACYNKCRFRFCDYETRFRVGERPDVAFTSPICSKYGKRIGHVDSTGEAFIVERDCGCRDCGCKDCGCKDCGCKNGGCKNGGCKNGGCKNGGCKNGGCKNGGHKDCGCKNGGHKDCGCKNGGHKDCGCKNGGCKNGGCKGCGCSDYACSKFKLVRISKWYPYGLKQNFSPSFFKSYGIYKWVGRSVDLSGIGHETPQQNQLQFLHKQCVVVPLTAYQVLDSNGNVVRNVHPRGQPHRDCVAFETYTY